MANALGGVPDNMMEREVDLSEATPDTAFDDGTRVSRAGNVVVVDFDPGSQARGQDTKHYENLATVLDENELSRIGADVIETVDEDLQTRKEWLDRLARGIRLMGVTDDDGAQPFPGASTAVHPMLAEAGVQFQARAIAELFPPGGPVKGTVLGEADDEIDARRERGEGYMNYQYTDEIPEAFDEQDKLLFRLPFDGSAFKKVYVDSAKRRISLGFVAGEDLIVPYTASNLESTPCCTHRIRYYPNDMRKLQRSKFYRDVDLGEPADALKTDDNPVRDEIDNSEGRSGGDLLKDRQYEVYEQYREFDLPGHEDTDPETGEKTGIGLPYIVTVEKETQQVLAIYRNWKPEDPDKKKRLYFVHYKFLPGFGFYGFGLLHTIGGLSRAATGALRALLDAAQLSNMRGGFKAKDAKVPGGEITFKPGEWKDVESTADELKKAFFPLEYKEPSKVLYELLGFLVEAGTRFASTTEAMVGDAKNTGPVGTTVALIEQGSKVFSAIHKRLHRAQRAEFKLVAELNYETLPAGKPYPYRLANEEKHVIRDDFDGRIDWVPVSDPNIFSSTQRISLAQAILQLSEAAPDLYNKRKVHERMLDALKAPDPDELLLDTEPERLDPVSENMALLYGKPIGVFPDQDHRAHMVVHEAWFGDLPPEGQKMLQGAFYAHLAEHIAFAYRIKLEQAAGIRMPYLPDFRARPGEKMMRKPLPPELDNQISSMAAQASQVMKQSKPSPQEQENAAEDAKAKAEAARKDALAMADTRRRDAVAAADQKRKDAEVSAQIRRDDMAAMADQRRGNIDMAAGIRRDDMESMASMGRYAG